MKLQFRLQNGTLALKEAAAILNDYLSIKSGKVRSVHSVSDGVVMISHSEFIRQISESAKQGAESAKMECDSRSRRGKPKIRRVK